MLRHRSCTARRGGGPSGLLGRLGLFGPGGRVGRFGRVAVLAAAAVASWSSAAEAQGRRILVLPLSSDFLSDAVVSRLDAGMRDQVAAVLPRYEVLPRPALDLASLKVAAGCASDGPECLVLIGRAAQAGLVVQVTLQGSHQQAKLQVRRVSSRRGKESNYEAELLDVGRDSEKELRWHVSAALGVQPPPLMGRIVLTSGAKASRLSGAQVLLDDRTVSRAALERVRPGQHRIEVRKTGFRTFVRMIRVRPGRDTVVRVDLAPRQAPPKPAPPAVSAGPQDPPPTATAVVEESSGPIWGWVLGISAVVAASTATVFGVQVLGLQSDAESAQLDCDARDRSNEICEDGRSRALMANVTWGVAGALAAGAIIAFIVESSGGEDDTAARVGIAPTSGGVGASLQLDF